MRTFTSAAFLTSCVWAVGTAHGQSVESFYRQNNQIQVVVGYDAGIDYDRWARLVTQYMGQYIPGSPKFIVKNMPGAGSINAANYLYTIAPKDGTAIGAFTRNLPMQARLGKIPSIQMDPRKFGWIGSPELGSRVCTGSVKSGVATVDDLMTKELVIGGTGPASGPSYLPKIINQLAGTKFKVIDGYSTSDAIYLAMEREELDGTCGNYKGMLRNIQRQLDDGKTRILFNMERKRNPEIPNVPSIFEYLKDPENNQVFSFITSTTEMGRPLVAPPDVPADRLAALRAAFVKATSDPDFLNDTKKLKLDVTVTTGEDLTAVVDTLFAMPQPLIDRALAMMPATISD
jgi:tripartite-type tricarboxylate transporter receptor subunit TctC